MPEYDGIEQIAIILNVASAEITDHGRNDMDEVVNEAKCTGEKLLAATSMARHAFRKGDF